MAASIDDATALQTKNSVADKAAQAQDLLAILDGDLSGDAELLDNGSFVDNIMDGEI